MLTKQNRPPCSGSCGLLPTDALSLSPGRNSYSFLELGLDEPLIAS